MGLASWGKQVLDRFFKKPPEWWDKNLNKVIDDKVESDMMNFKKAMTPKEWEDLYLGGFDPYYVPNEEQLTKLYKLIAATLEDGKGRIAKVDKMTFHITWKEGLATVRCGHNVDTLEFLTEGAKERIKELVLASKNIHSIYKDGKRLGRMIVFGTGSPSMSSEDQEKLMELWSEPVNYGLVSFEEQIAKIEPYYNVSLIKEYNKMNTKTGEILEGVKLEELSKLLTGDLMQVDPDDMTDKQKKEMKVSLHDNRSKLGKKRVSYVNGKKHTRISIGTNMTPKKKKRR